MSDFNENLVKLIPNGVMETDSQGNPYAISGGFPATRTLYVDKNRTDTYVSTGSVAAPFKTIAAAVNQIISNGDNSTVLYTVSIALGAYSETIILNSSSLYNLNFIAPNNNVSVAGISSTSNNTQLATLLFSNIGVFGDIVLTGDTNNTNFGSVEIVFTNCSINTGSTGLVLNNVNNVSFYSGQIQNTTGACTFTNVAFAYIEGAEGLKSGTTLHLVQNNSGNQPLQSTGNYLLLSTTKCYSTVTVDAGSELDAIQTYFGSGSSISNTGIVHSFESFFNGTYTGNSGSTNRFRGDIFVTEPSFSSSSPTNQGIHHLGSVVLGSSAVAATNTILVGKDGHIKSTQTTAPTTTTNANAGTGASSSVSHATDIAGNLSLITGSGSWASGVQTTVNFNLAYNAAPIVVLTPSNNNAANNTVVLGVFVSSTVNGFSINFASAATSALTHTWIYHVIETQ